MVKTTLLRVKRRRDDAPPPSKIKVAIEETATTVVATIYNNNGDTDCTTTTTADNTHTSIVTTNAGTVSSIHKRARHGMNRGSQINQLTNLMNHTSIVNSSNSTNGINISNNNTDATNNNNNNTTRAVIFQKVKHFNKFNKHNLLIPNNNSNSNSNNLGCKRKNSDVLNTNQQIINNHHQDNAKDIHLNVIDAILERQEGEGDNQNININMNVRKQSYYNASSSLQSQQTTKSQSQLQSSYPQQPPIKRKKLSLQMMDSRTMTEQEFWNDIHNNNQSHNNNIHNNIIHTANSNSDTTATTSTTSTTSTTTTNIIHNLNNQPPSRMMSTLSSKSSSSSFLTKKNAKKSNVILDPITQLINQSLQSLHPSYIDNPNNINTSSATNTYNDHPTTYQNPTTAIMTHLNLIQLHSHSSSSKLLKFINWQCIPVVTKSTSTSASASASASSMLSNNPKSNNGSTILHMTALLNSTSGANYICTNYSGIIDFNILDSDGYTARDVAELAGSDGVATIISNYMGMCTGTTSISSISSTHPIINSRSRYGSDNNGINNRDMNRDNTKEEREDDYVYDIYCLKQDDGDDNESNNKHDSDDDDIRGGNNNDNTRTSTINMIQEQDIESRIDEKIDKGKDISDGNRNRLNMVSSGSYIHGHNIENGQREGLAVDNVDNECDFSTTSSTDHPVLVQMRGGVGYWNEKGELILEATPNNGNDGHPLDIDDDDDHDSNCEDYEGNDYPDDDDEEDNHELFEGEYHKYPQNSNTINDTWLPQSIIGYTRGPGIGNDEEYDSDEDYYERTSQFRNCNVNYMANGNYSMHQYGDDEEDDMEDGDYSGYMHTDASQWSLERIYGETEAYDPNDVED